MNYTEVVNFPLLFTRCLKILVEFPLKLQREFCIRVEQAALGIHDTSYL